MQNMQIKSEKGIAVTDIAISVIVIFTFITLISTLAYRFNTSSKELELKSKAITLAVQEIEKLRKQTLSGITSYLTSNNMKYGKDESSAPLQEITGKDGFYRKIILQDYHDIDNTKETGIVKRVKVEIQYKFKKKIESVELWAMISK